MVPKGFDRDFKKQLKKFAKQRRDAMAKHLKERKKEVVQYVIDTIRDDIRNNATNPKTGKQFRALSSRTLEARKRIAAKNPTHTNYSLTKPNLTITGRFLDGMRGKMRGSKVKGYFVELFFKGVHKKYKPLTNRRRRNAKRNRVMNTDIHEGMKALGRDPIDLSKKNFDEVNKFVGKELTKAFEEK